MTLVTYLGKEDGTIEDVEVLQTSGNADLDRAAVDCVSHWHFDPKIVADRFNIGRHRTNIAWTFSENPSDSFGRFVGVAHTCANYYPEAERKAQIEGQTLLQFTITDAGEVQDPVIVQSSGNANLDEAALRCVRTWRYRPAVQSGKPVAVLWKAYVDWKLVVPQPPPFAETPRDCIHYYPVTAGDLAGIDGTTVLSFEIYQGDVEDVRVVQSSGNTTLDNDAVECVSTRKYVREKVAAGNTIVDRYHSITVRERISWPDALKPVVDTKPH
jgi:TonB family protein